MEKKNGNRTENRKKKGNWKTCKPDEKQDREKQTGSFQNLPNTAEIETLGNRMGPHFIN
jgi:hypothetical protein